MPKENIMDDRNNNGEPLPDSFETEEDAGAFWDTHSVGDYEDLLEPAEHVIAIDERVFEVRVAEDVFQKLQQQATTMHQTVPKVVDQILRKQLP